MKPVQITFGTDLHALKILESTWDNAHRTKVIRLPHGWIWNFYDEYNGVGYQRVKLVSSVFVPERNA